ncbi:alpha/beta hydrolase family protein [Clostridium tepidiprofundi DSM 19306]|uniref:Alpha/beta hydrolase family protein n=1 Tax=Clostridium tepidiprofundi DSM 19306 TaxID=1121338 RepID=A0A151AVY2_9CLOT|nr:DUF3887 domain-containing protein [Clostridium tepidiprofundi]KYH31771.1 alpha/beta hydrolase family protein [Clostridium tepidiprofundi DSM 19306]
MKKFLTILLSIVVIISFSACSDKSNSVNSTNNAINTSDNTGNKSNSIKHNENLEKIAVEFVNELSKGNFESAYNKFGSSFKKAITLKKLKETWATASTQVGEVNNILGTRTEHDDKFDKVFVTCKFDKTTLDIQVTFDKDKNIVGFFFVKTKIIPKSNKNNIDDESKNIFYEKEVTIGAGEWALPGILTIPKGKGNFPAVVLVHGSGPNDRDETIGPNKPFRDLAHGLASKGIVVLRYDKRTLVYGKKMLKLKKGITVQTETIDDALLAINLLRNRKEVDKSKIFVLGHSLGGSLLPRIEQQDSNIAGLICLAGSARPLEDFFVEQYTYLFSLDGKITDKEKDILEQTKKDVEKIKSLDVNNYDTNEILINVPAGYWVDLKQHNIAEIVKKSKKPMLILQGERDYQVTMKDFQLWKKLLSNRKNVEFKSYKKLNHLFMEGTGKSSPNEYYIENHIPQYVIDDISNWIKK